MSAPSRGARYLPHTFSPSNQLHTSIRSNVGHKPNTCRTKALQVKLSSLYWCSPQRISIRKLGITSRKRYYPRRIQSVITVLRSGICMMWCVRFRQVLGVPELLFPGSPEQTKTATSSQSLLNMILRTEFADISTGPAASCVSNMVSHSRT